MQPVNDNLSFAGAMRLAQKIEHYWQTRGYDVKAWPQLDLVSEGATQACKRTVYVVRSNIAEVMCGEPVRVTKH